MKTRDFESTASGRCHERRAVNGRAARLVCAAEPGSCKRLGAPLPPPDLVIQDELHLIAGPLGAMAGLYEEALEALRS